MCGLFSSLFSWARRLFANCSKLPQRIATIVWHNKGALRENGTDIPHNLRKVLPAKPMQAHFPAGAAAAAAHSRPIKNCLPFLCEAIARTADRLPNPSQCSGVPIQQAVSLSSSFPRHCLLFVCAFFRKMQAGSWSEELPLPPVSCIQNRPGFHHGNRGGSFALGALFQSLTQNLARGLWVSPAYAGKISCSAARKTERGDHPRVCGEKTKKIP